MDGAGYPDGLTGAGIRWAARIIAVCDAYDAMTATERAYKEPFSPARARAHIAADAGSHFYPLAATAFLEAVEDGAELA